MICNADGCAGSSEDVVESSLLILFVSFRVPVVGGLVVNWKFDFGNARVDIDGESCAGTTGNTRGAVVVDAVCALLFGRFGS